MEKRHENSESLTLPSGRTLAWNTYGTLQDPAATIFYFHGFPGCSLEASYLSGFLYKHNARCIAIDRPGMGKSTHYTRKVTDWPSDVLAVADHMHIDQFYILGVSGGAPYALACARAYSIPRAGSDRLRGVAVVSGMYPTTLGVDGMLPELRTLLFLGAWVPRFAGALLDFLLGRPARDKDPRVLEEVMDKAMARRPEMERVVWEDENVRAAATDSSRGAFERGGAGVAMELVLLGNWGFGLEDVDGMGVRLWHGRLDRNVPVGMAERAAALMPGCRTCFLEGDGHMSMSFCHAEVVLEDLLGVGSAF
jgi:pimeloyl-ACP methyl ester carboxylesterase